MRMIQGKVMQNARKVEVGGSPLSDLGGVKLVVLVRRGLAKGEKKAPKFFPAAYKHLDMALLECLLPLSNVFP